MPDEIKDLVSNPPAPEHECVTDDCCEDYEPESVLDVIYPEPSLKLGDKVWRLNWVSHPDRADIEGQTLGWLSGTVTGSRMFGRHLAYCLDDDAQNWYFEEELATSKEERLARLV